MIGLSRLTLACCGLAALIGAATPAKACDPQVTRVSAPRNDPYEPFSPDVATYSLDIDVRNRSDRRCDFRLVALSDSAGPRMLFGTRSGEKLAYDLTFGSGIRIPNEQAGSFGAPVSLGPNSEQTLRLQLRINPGQVVGSGHFDEQLRLRLVDNVGNLLANERRIPVSVRVQSRAQVNIAGSAGNFSSGMKSATLNLGSIERGATGRIFIQVRANEPVVLRIESQNGGILRHVSARDQSVPYAFSVDGRRLNLSGPASLTKRPPRSLDGAAYEAITTVNPVQGRLAGEYRDVVTISVDACG